MTVFIVTVNDWEDTEIMGVFSTREKAEVFVSTLEESERINSEITPFVVV